MRRNSGAEVERELETFFIIITWPSNMRFAKIQFSVLPVY